MLRLSAEKKKCNCAGAEVEELLPLVEASKRVRFQEEEKVLSTPVVPPQVPPLDNETLVPSRVAVAFRCVHLVSSVRPSLSLPPSLFLVPTLQCRRSLVSGGWVDGSPKVSGVL